MLSITFAVLVNFSDSLQLGVHGLNAYGIKNNKKVMLCHIESG